MAEDAAVAVDAEPPRDDASTVKALTAENRRLRAALADLIAQAEVMRDALAPPPPTLELVLAIQRAREHVDVTDG